MKIMNKSLRILVWIVTTTMVCSSAPVFGKEGGSDKTTGPDNTRMNKEPANRKMSADQQGQHSSDVTVTQKIRKRLNKDKSLSTYAHNVKIITRNGMVTLKGPVRSEKEKGIVEQVAGEVAGKDNVTSEIAVAPKK